MFRLHAVLAAGIIAVLPCFAQLGPGLFPTNNRLNIGSVTKTPQGLRYHLYANFGIEQWEGSKRTTHRTQQWFLSCSYPDYDGAARTYCGLERVVIDRWPTMKGAVISETEHSTTDGQLQIRHADWAEGKLDFEILFPMGGGPVRVFLDMQYEDYEDRGISDYSSIYLSGFTATATVRGVYSGEVATVSYKIPEYTYVEDVPIEMGGLKSQDKKLWDDMFGSLAAADQTLWTALEGEWRKALAEEFDGFMEENQGRYEGRREPLTKREQLEIEQRLKNRMLLATKKLLSESGMSQRGQERILDCMAQQSSSF